MGRRLGQAAGGFGLLLLLLRLDRLLLSGDEYPPWKLILLTSVVLGGVVWWLLEQTRIPLWARWAVLAAGGAVLFLRVAVPETLAAGVIATGDTLAALDVEMEQSIRLIRHGVAPIVPHDGVIALLGVVMWAVGALFAWGMSEGRVIAMFLPTLVVYLQFAIFDRAHAGMGWMMASALLLVLGVVAIGTARRTDSGRARDADGRPLHRRSPTSALVIGAALGIAAVVVASSASGLVSEYGNLPWRTGAGYGLGGGGVYFDRFVDLQQQLVNPNNTLLFRATTTGAPGSERLYWRMETLDEFDGVRWKRSTTATRPFEPGRAAGDPEHHYQGATADVLQFVRIAALRGPVIPTAGVVDEIHDIDTANSISPRSFEVGQDGALVYLPELGEGDEYQVRTSYPLSDADLGRLATGADGELSPIFANAAEAGEFDHEPEPVSGDIARPADIEFYTRLPDNLPTDLRGQALLRTEGATTDFERAWMLEAWFRSDDFEYDATVSTGHSSLDLADWLTDPTSTNYRTGYCEQFATGMAVLGRVLGIPTRVVWGFTPGTVVDQDGTPVIEVRDTNAHAWVEMWMDGVGWVRFDPTPRADFVEPTAAFDPTGFLPEPDELSPGDSGNVPLPDPGAGFFEPETPVATTGSNLEWWMVALPVLALAIGLVPGLKLARRRRRIRRLRDGDVTAAWDEIVDRLTDLGRPVHPSATPIELAGMTSPALMPLATSYAAAVYGGRARQGRETDLLAAENWIYERFDGVDRVRAALSPRSLFRG